MASFATIAQPRKFKGTAPAPAAPNSLPAPDGASYKVLDPDSCQLKAAAEEDDADGPGYIEGYASVFGNVDLGGDIVLKGAFNKTLKDRLKKGMIKLYDSHRVFEGTEAVIGVVEEAKEDDYGLWFKARLSAVKRAQNIRTKVKEKILNAVSFGYDVIKDQWDDEKKVRTLKELRLHEISIVPWGMNPEAHITGAKGVEEPPVEDPPVDPPVQDPPVDPPVPDESEVALKAAEEELLKSVLSYGTVVSLRTVTAGMAAAVEQIRSK